MYFSDVLEEEKDKVRKIARKQRRQEGARETAIKNAINLLKEGDSPEKVARCIGLSFEEVQKLAEEIK